MKILKRYINKIISTTLLLYISIYCQSGYAYIEKRLYVDKDDSQQYMAISISDEIITTELAIEIAGILANKTYRIGYLFIDDVQFEVGTIPIIIQALETNPFIRELIFLQVSFSEHESTQTIINVLNKLKNLRALHLGKNFRGHCETIIYNTLVTNSKLAVLTLRENKISDNDVALIANVLHGNKILRALELSRNKIKREGAKYLANIIRDTRTLRSLDIADNEIDYEGLNEIIVALINNITIQYIWADWSIKQREVVKLIMERNRLIMQVNNAIRKFVRKVDTTVLLGYNSRVGQGSPLNLVPVEILREIIIDYRENELEVIMNLNEMQIIELPVEEREIIYKIREMQNIIIKCAQATSERLVSFISTF